MTEYSEEKRPSLDCPFAKVHPSELHRDDSYYMWHAYNEAINAWKEDEVPVGAVIVHEGQIIAKAYNRRDQLKDPTAHAEILAITQAAEAIDNWRLNACTLYVTKEPCPMCSGAIIMSRIGRIVYALGDPKMGCLGGVTNLGSISTMNHHPEITQGVLTDQCQELFQAYFQLKRLKSSS